MLENRERRPDGTLLYQLYLVRRVLEKTNVVFTPEIIAHYRVGNIPDFGNSKTESSNYTPGQQTTQSSLSFIKGMLEIPKVIDKETKQKTSDLIFDDMANYSYPFLEIQRKKGLKLFIPYAIELGRLGFRNKLILDYFFMLVVMGNVISNRLINSIKLSRLYTSVRKIKVKILIVGDWHSNVHEQCIYDSSLP